MEEGAAGAERTLTMAPMHADLIAALAHRERQIEAIRRLSDALFSLRSVDAMVGCTLKIALEILRADAGAVLLHDSADDTLVYRHAIGVGGGSRLTGQRVPASQGVFGTVFRTGKPLLTGVVRKRGDYHPVEADAADIGSRSVLTVPVRRTDADPIGVLQVLNARVTFTESDIEVLEVLCAQAATGVEHLRLVEEARRAQIVNVIGDISHDIKNMLTPILTGVWTLEPMLRRLFADLDAVATRLPDDEPWTAELIRAAAVVRHDYEWILESAVDAAEQVQARTKEVADAIRGELSPPHFEIADLNDTCREVVRPLRAVAERAGVRLALKLDDDLPKMEFDRRQMYNALYNLVNNALPETPAGGTVGLITIAPGKPGGDPHQVTVQVRDTGRGMPEAVRSRLFTDQAISTKPGGTGLGTRIVAGVVRRHNGRIAVQSEPGKGTVFTLRLPLQQDQTVLSMG